MRTVLILICSVLLGGVSAQQECKQRVLNVYDRLLELTDEHNPDHVFHLSYTAETVARVVGPGQQGPVQTDVSLYSNGIWSCFYSNQIDVFQQEEFVVSVLHGDKSIRIMPAENEDYKKTKMENLSFIQAEMFEQLQVVSCEKEKIEGKKMLKVEMALERKDPGIPVKRMTFWLNEEDEQLEQVEIIYTEQSPLEAIKVKFNTITYNYLEEVEGKTLLDAFEASLDQLKAAYPTYQVEDYRNAGAKQ